MEVEVSKVIPYWDALRLGENRALAEELAQEGLIIFEHESITLHHASYEKDFRNISM